MPSLREDYASRDGLVFSNWIGATVRGKAADLEKPYRVDASKVDYESLAQNVSANSSSVDHEAYIQKKDTDRINWLQVQQIAFDFLATV